MNSYESPNSKQWKRRALEHPAGPSYKFLKILNMRYEINIFKKAWENHRNIIGNNIGIIIVIFRSVIGGSVFNLKAS